MTNWHDIVRLNCFSRIICIMLDNDNEWSKLVILLGIIYLRKSYPAAYSDPFIGTNALSDNFANFSEIISDSFSDIIIICELASLRTRHKPLNATLCYIYLPLTAKKLAVNSYSHVDRL